MRILLLSLQNETEDAGHSGSTRARMWRLEEEQTLALVRTMRDGGRLAPLLVCLKGSRLHERARALNLPLLAVSGAGPGNPLTLLRLWNWQRKRKKLLIQTVGEEALALGRRVLRMRPAGGGLLAHAFFLRPPAPELCNGRDMTAARHILCGSEHVRGRILAAWARAPQKSAAPENRSALLPLPPGICLDGFDPAPPPFQADAGRHFVFGMGESLAPRSGALLVARAMSAIWQRDDLPPWEVRMTGGGPRFREVLDEAASLGVESRLCLLGEQPEADVLAHCHAWLAPGSSPEEGPATLWAGFAAGLPVVCSQSALHLERLRGHDGAVLPVAENDPQALAKAMIDVMRDAELRRALGRRGAALVRDAGLQAMAERACRLFETWLQEAENAGGESAPAEQKQRAS
ncbi:glycosyltransferase family 4 protein [Desulfovibrio sp. SGI.169]|uniref:glycosyltransferase family 4 protein n=1 Tax=Desulfovibrio sp. SGI.169 TaxID=3420561 RepID=UPI003CFEC10F